LNTAITQEFDQTLKELTALRSRLSQLPDAMQNEPFRDALFAQLNVIEARLAQILRGQKYEIEFDLLRNTAKLLAKAVDEKEVLKAILDGLRHAIYYDAAGIFLISEDEESGTRTIRAQEVRGYSMKQHDHLQQKIDEGLLGWVVEHQQGIVVDDVLNDPRYFSARPATNSEAIAPIISKGEVIGCINIEADRKAAFFDDSLYFLENLASLAAIALDQAKTHKELVEARELEKELEIARTIQTKLLPDENPVVKGYDIAGLNVPSQSVGGDYYDYIQITPGDLGMVVADVAGKGVPAGLVMAGMRAALRARVETVYSIRHVIRDINTFLYESTGAERFVTAFYCVLNLELGQITYVNAGHNYPFILHTDGEVEWLVDGGPLLGAVEEADYTMATAEMEEGAILVMYTDGIVEAGGQKGEEFGEQRVVELVKSLANAPADRIAKTLEREAVLFNRSSRGLDDRTVIVVKRT
jgi:sigma-B regulation protein RsbU (phosphoserine phosphatase)